jgi:hypothetical protein
MLTASATVGHRPDLGQFGGVADRRQLNDLAIGPAKVAAQIAAGRWRLCGGAIVLHNAQLTSEQRWTAALVNCGPRSVLTSFTAAHAHGLRGWDRDEVHVLAPAGTKLAPVDEFAIRLHLAGDWSRVRQIQPRRLHDLAQATVLAASSFAEPRSASGLLAATVQQRLLRAGALAQAVDEAPRLRHRAAMVHAVADIEQGAQALSEIDFVRLCRRNGLPKPTHQAVRRDASGRRRYLDASWTLPGDRIVAVEVDGALHLNVRTWRNDQLRQNELVLDGMVLLRYPSDVVRYEEQLVVAQLRRALSAASR